MTAIIIVCLLMAVLYFILAIIFGSLSILCVRFIAKNEGRMPELKSLFTRKSKSDDLSSDNTNAENTKVLLNVPAIISIVGVIVVIVLLDYINKSLGM